MMAVFFFMFFRGCFLPKGQQPQPIVTTKIDTVWKMYQSPQPVATQPIVIATQQPSIPQSNTIREIIYKNDTTVIKELLERYYSKVYYKDVLQVDTNGSTVTVTDTISENSIRGRSFVAKIKYPVISKETIKTFPYQPRNKFYYGFGVGANKADLINSFKAGFALKNKKDQIFILNGTIHKQGGLGAEVSFMRKF